MKTWRVYRTFEDRDPQLVAWTDDKKMIKIYKSERNMKDLIIQSSDLDDDELSDMKKECAMTYLDYHPFTTRVILDDGVIDFSNKPIVTTMYEYIATTDDTYIPGLDESAFDYPLLPDTKCYSKPMRKALKQLEYDFWYRFNKNVAEDYSTPDTIQVDELSIFIRNFGDLFI